MKKTKYIWQIYFLRGLAVIGMIIFHILYAAKYFGYSDLALFQGGWQIFGHSIRFTFLTLVGVALSLSRNKRLDHIYEHGLKILFYALIISLSTYIFAPDRAIRFGILHSIAFGIFFAAPLRKSPYIALLASLAIYFTHTIFHPEFTTNLFTIILGFKDTPIFDLDYFPLFPWSSLIFLGIFLGSFLNVDRQRPLAPKITRPINWIGKYSLEIYMIHVPTVVLTVYLVIHVLN